MFQATDAGIRVGGFLYYFCMKEKLVIVKLSDKIEVLREIVFDFDFFRGSV